MNSISKKRHRAPYVTRIVVSLAFGYLIYRHGGGIILLPVALYFFLSLMWIAIVEFRYEAVLRHPANKLFRDFIDICFISLMVVMSGGPYSFMLLMYLGWIVGSSMYTTRIYGLFAAVMILIQYGALLILLHAGLLPRCNLFSGIAYELSVRHSVISYIALAFTALVLHDFMYRIYSKLQYERNTARERNDVIARDLELAKNIQLKLIPVTNSSDNIFVLYRPRHVVGGDFYDILRFRDPNKIGIFLCDVCGHGFSAALVTSMIKTLILQSGMRKDNPEELFLYINDALMGQLGRVFFTALYCVIDMNSGVINCANAGHHFPILIGNGEISYLKAKRSVPLGIMSNEEMAEYGKPISSSLITVPRGSRILMYTDCLVEANCGSYNVIPLNEDELLRVAGSLRDLPGGLFVQRLSEILVQPNGSEELHDDLSIIAVDIV